MTAQRERSRSTAILPREVDAESSYRSWKARRPTLFRQNSQLAVSSNMSRFNCDVQMAVMADNQDHLVPLPKTLYDNAASLSIISDKTALATLGGISQTPNVFHSTSLSRNPLTSTSSITLRCRYDGGLQSFQETFHIVDSTKLGGYDGVVRGNIAIKPPGADGSLPSAHPVMYGPTGRKGKDEKTKREQEIKSKELSYQEQVKQQREQLRRQLDGGKGGITAGGGGGRRT